MLEEDVGSSFFSEDELTLVSLDDELAIVLSEEDSMTTSSEEEDCSTSLAEEELSSPQATISRAENRIQYAFFISILCMS
jgi:hypothetical protein